MLLVIAILLASVLAYLGRLSHIRLEHIRLGDRQDAAVDAV